MKLFPFTLALFISWLAAGQQAHAQTLQISGTVVDSLNKEAVVGAYVAVSLNIPDAKPAYVTTDLNGKFVFPGISAKASYLVKVSYLSYKEFSKIVNIGESNLDLGRIELTEAISNLKEVKIVGQVAAMEQKGDTTQFNAAAFKTNPDATTEDLIQKMPGITVANGTVTAHGETVNRVLVDGKPFFGEDATLTLKSLPAEIVDKIEVFDKLSDQAQFTGFDDGNAQKTINIVTKADRKMGQFGRVFAGYGLDDRYQAGGNVSFFKGDQRISVIGLSNNINNQNFSGQDLLGVSGGGGGRGNFGGGGSASNNFMVGNQSGITRTNSIGLNYSNKIGKKVDVSGSYFFNRTGNSNVQAMNQEYFIANGSGNQFYKEDSRTSTTNANHRLNFRIEYNINPNNSLILTPRLSFQDNQSSSTRAGLTTLGNGQVLNASNNNQFNNNSGYNFSNDLLFRHSFAKKGRTISLNVNTQFNDRNGTRNLYSQNRFFEEGFTTGMIVRGDTIDQMSYTNSDGITLGGNLIYTEPISKTGQLQFNYGLNVSNSNSSRETYNMSFDSNTYSSLDTLLTNNFYNRYITNRAGIGYRYRKNSWSANVGLDFQNAGLYSEQLAPVVGKVDQSFTNLLPNAMVSYRSKSGTQFRAFFRSSTSQPSISQLQNVVDNSNPLSLTAGNPDLKQEYRSMFNIRYSLAGANRPYNFNAMVFVTQTNNAIVNSTIIANEPGLTLPNGVVLERGAKYTAPVNVDGSWNARTFLTYGKPVAPLKLNINLTTGFNYVRSPGLINNVSNFSNTYAASQGLVISSNISDKLDFTASYSGNYNIVRNTIQPNLNNNYYTQSLTGRVNWIFGKNFVFQTDVSNQSYRGLGEGFNRNFTLWNASIGKKFLKNNAGEIKLTVFDILKQNNSITRNVTETYVQDVTNRVLTQYAMLTFTYTLKNFGKVPSGDNGRRREWGEGEGGSRRREGGSFNRDF